MIIVVLVLLALLLPVLGLVYLYRRPLPQVSGTIKLNGLKAPVEILRDRWGVPHIYAQGEEDLFFAQGFVHAQDRLWQMELHRRLGHGRLAEIVGEPAFPTDRLLRILGFGRAAQNDFDHADAETRQVLEAYARGVNAFLETNSGRLPLEFTILRFKPEPWRPADSLAWGKMMAWGLCSNWDGEILRTALVEKLGAERAAELHGHYPASNPLILQDQTWHDLVDQIREQFRAAERMKLFGGLRGLSNNWVVDGAKSVTGRPLLANDPHLSLHMPSIWYENHLVAPEMEVTGVSIPGLPSVLIGHNANIAWGVTVALPDVQDLYVERFDPNDPTRYEYQGKWEQVTVLHEAIRVKGEAQPRNVEVVVTRHGPVINAASPLAGKEHWPRLAVRWVGHEPSRTSNAIIQLNRARNWQEFSAALRQWDLPGTNFVYADREGNIGYRFAGKVPIRAKGMGLLPAPGWTGEYEWIGWIPPEELPHAFNPPQHFLATANNQIVGKEYPYFLSTEALSGYRARRVVDLLTAQEKFGLDDFARMHVDLYCGPARPFCELLTKLTPDILKQPILADCQSEVSEALAFVHGWDFRLTADSVAGAIYEMTQYFAMWRVFEPWLGNLTKHYIGVGFHPILAPVTLTYLDRCPLLLQNLLIENERQWFKDAQGKPLTREAILAFALKDAIDYFRRTAGPDVRQWRWGRVHAAAFNHPLGVNRVLRRVFSRGPFPYGGDANTVWQASFVPQLPFEAGAGFTATWRQIIDVGDWDNSVGVHPPGQSGHPASRHYADQIPLWLKGEYHPMLWSREKVEANLKARLVLDPK